MKPLNREEEEFCFYVSGFVDGEGCFSVSFRALKRLTVGFETKASFSVGQKQTKQNYELLNRLRVLFKGGSIRTSEKDSCYKYETRALGHIRSAIIPFFKEYPLYTSKSKDFEIFCKICSLIAAKQHLNKAGLLQIVDLSEAMNPSGSRRLQLSIIRAQLKVNL
jgi:hypothetical protein